jgi:hypothetical protein
MTPTEENLFMKLADDIEVPGELAEEDKDFLKNLETMAAEIESEVDNSN